jgi:hypothetical protein
MLNMEQRIFGQFSSSTTQRPTTLDPVKIILDTHQDTSGEELSIDFIKGDITVKKSGIYLIIAGLQVNKLAGNKPRWIDFWIRINHIDVPNSNVRTVVKDPAQKEVIITQLVTTLNKGDMLSIMMSVEAADEGLGIEAIHPINEPQIPSIILTILQI